ncbi:3-hydroxyisobutyrate dehydrogenase-like beta-hydroxyacid dehydrogenase [Spinactinospora alkalitolerans]|uniref:3-hydroxyisobutyrate dehydrogenase-like beta-hydroxyacid dehydrogenase n=1 Tax=Spinactinospora alkalitolerans TaxID=687207 RepID=A0A852U5S7_9ACTN|nr:NAD(P)-binding domain-containing protein [Spinactinospora alkalitolerans]NYE50945.1 3-hydroxyisobutyrate dehydrogenase-like beta-hydroxyacid dehydrogenase [Spinactinospora alkalitolerans]
MHGRNPGRVGGSAGIGTEENAAAGGDRSAVTVIGLGAMGAALANAFLDSGRPTTVWNRSPEKADGLVAEGAVRAATATEAVSASPLVVVCVLDYRAVHDVLGPAGAALSGRVLVNLTNGTPEQARRTAAWAAERGADYLDGGIMAVPPMIGSPESVLLYSGSADAFEAHRRTLEILGTGRHLGADAGLAPLHDLAMLTGAYGMFAGFLQAVAMVGTERAEVAEFTSSLLVPWLNAMTTELPRLAERVDTGDHATDVGSNLAMQAAAFPNLVDAAGAQGVDAGLLAPVRALLDRGVAEGHGAEELSSLVELLRKPAPA